MIGLTPELQQQLQIIVDDVTVEERFPKVYWSSNPAVRLAQRKCFLMSEWYEEQIEYCQALAKEETVRDARYQQQYANFRGPGTSEMPKKQVTQFKDNGWVGIEATMPAQMRKVS